MTGVTLPASGAVIAVDTISAESHQLTKIEFGVAGAVTQVSATDPLPIGEIEYELGLRGGMTTLRDRQVAQRYTVLADSIADGLAAFWTQTSASGGTITVASGEGLLQTSASATGAAYLASTNIPFLIGQQNWLITTIRFGDTGSAGNIRRVGIFTTAATVPQDGFYFELNGTVLNVVSVRGGTPTAVASTAWSRVALAPFTLDTNYHRFEIRWTANNVFFYIDNVLRHVVSGSSVSPITNSLILPLTIQNVNSSGATNRVIAVRGIGAGRFGTPDMVKLGDFSTAVTFKPASTGVALTDTSLVVQDINLGNQIDSSAGTDTGQFSLIALFKRLLTKVPVQGSTVSATSLPVVLASDQANVADSWVAGNGAQLALNNNLVLGSTTNASDVLFYRSIGLQINTASGTVTAGVVTFEASNDNSNWQAVPLYDMISPTAAPVTSYVLTTGAIRTFVGPLYFRYFRARISTAVAGTTTGLQAFTRLSAQTYSPAIPSIAQSSAVSLQVTAALAAAQTLATVTTVGTVSSMTPIAPTSANLVSAATTNATSVKASSTRVWQITATNIGAAVCFLKLYNLAASPTVGTSVIFQTISIPAGGVPLNLPLGETGLTLGTGLAYALTNAIADADTTAIAASQVKLAISYT